MASNSFENQQLDFDILNIDVDNQREILSRIYDKPEAQNYGENIEFLSDFDINNIDIENQVQILSHLVSQTTITNSGTPEHANIPEPEEHALEGASGLFSAKVDTEERTTTDRETQLLKSSVPQLVDTFECNICCPLNLPDASAE